MFHFKKFLRDFKTSIALYSLSSIAFVISAISSSVFLEKTIFSFVLLATGLIFLSLGSAASISYVRWRTHEQHKRSLSSRREIEAVIIKSANEVILQNERLLTDLSTMNEMNDKLLRVAANVTSLNSEIERLFQKMAISIGETNRTVLKVRKEQSQSFSQLETSIITEHDKKEYLQLATIRELISTLESGEIMFVPADTLEEEG